MSNFKKGSAHIVFLLLIGVLVIVVGAYYFSRDTKPFGDDTKVYSSASGNFSFSYPGTFCMLEQNQYGTSVVGVADSKTCSAQTVNSGKIAALSISVASSSKEVATLDKWEKNYTQALGYSGLKLLKSDKTSVDGQPAVRLSINDDKFGRGEYFVVSLFRNGKVYIITATPASSDTITKIFKSIDFN
jgi:hypothetical protein